MLYKNKTTLKSNDTLCSKSAILCSLKTAFGPSYLTTRRLQQLQSVTEALMWFGWVRSDGLCIILSTPCGDCRGLASCSEVQSSLESPPLARKQLRSGSSKAPVSRTLGSQSVTAAKVPAPTDTIRTNKACMVTATYIQRGWFGGWVGVRNILYIHLRYQMCIYILIYPKFKS